jgi:3-dehydroquinate synthase
MREHKIRLATGYSIFLGRGLLAGEAIGKACLKLAGRWALVSDSTVLPLYAQPLGDRLRAAGLEIEIINFPAGEKHKTRATKAVIEDRMLDAGFGRDCGVLAVGGGVVSDIAGFIASTYARGVPVIYAPTTLLAMVDASIGGKTGLNTSHGKNLIGTLCQPKAVFADLETLATLSDQEFALGLIESIKHALLDSEAHFQLIASNLNDILSRRPETLEALIARSLEVKGDIVEKDEAERGPRQLLNLGHTFAHAIERASGYEIPHGAAVALGLLGEGQIAVTLGLLDSSRFRIIRKLIDRLLPVLPHDLSGLDRGELEAALGLDKKARNGRPRYVLLEDIGRPHLPDGQPAIEVGAVAQKAGLDYLFDRFARSC